MFQKMILVMLAEIARQDVNLVLKGTTRAAPLASNTCRPPDTLLELTQRAFSSAVAILPDDGPAKAILSYMGNNTVGDGETLKCPESWKGYRGLTDK